ncbi:hypothetical protein QZH41_019307 [Actinostola sp. cb2023]|nr:hypothetical protein QZH41_019307 [Actinostola sp. cb2023]
MGEIGAMVARLEQEGLDLEQLIDYELEAAGFLSLSERSTDSLSDRVDAISGNQSELKCLLKSIEDQLRMVQTEENIPENLLDDKKFADDDNGVKHVIVIEDDEEMKRNDIGCQANMESDLPPITAATTGPLKPSDEQPTSQATTTITKTANHNTPTVAATKVSFNQKKTPVQLLPKPSIQITKTLPILPKLVTSSAESTSRSTGTPLGVIAYRTLKSPAETGPASVVSVVTVKSSQPVIHPEQIRGATAPTTPSASTIAAVKSSKPVIHPEHIRGATAPTTPSASTIAATPVTQ